MASDDIARFAADDVVEARQSATLISQTLKVFQWVGNSPSGKRVDDNVEFVAGCHFTGATVPLENPFVEAAYFLNERRFEVQASAVGGVDRIDWDAHRPSKLGEDHLLGLVDGVGAAQNHNPCQNGKHAAERRKHCVSQAAGQLQGRMVDGELAHGLRIVGLVARVWGLFLDG